MGLFDFFGKKKQERDDSGLPPELLKIMIRSQVEACKNGVDSDEIPGGYGAFGLCKTNPVPTFGIPGSYEYLARLRTDDGHPVESSRMGSTSAKDVTSGMIDIYRVSRGGENLATVFLCPYHKRNSGKAPDGFRLE
ncbi:MAG: hypothetical protein LBI31_06700 [Zoogloeaceae bacterium]|nr:hypothetical protein [Zoogloeaceae bacterium]